MDAVALPSPRDGVEVQSPRAAGLGPAIGVGYTPRVCVGLATRGRPAILAALVDQLQCQTLRPSSIIVACATLADVAGLAEGGALKVILAPPGLARQRNAILDEVDPDCGMLVFFDDDFVPHPAWIAAAAAALGDHPHAACVTGHVIADGIKGPGIAFDQAREMLATDAPPSAGRSGVVEYSPYGCNMAFRRSAIRHRRFDERLVLYGWLEDRDFGGALARDGWKLLKIASARGVHLGVKRGRVAGRSLGYSQVMNPFYLRWKGTMSWTQVADHIFRNVMSNLTGAVRPEPYIDRRGRLSGNLLAFVDLMRGRLTPERAERL